MKLTQNATADAMDPELIHLNPMRRTVCAAVLGLLLLPACDVKPGTVTLDVVLFSYLERPIFDVFISRKWAGDAGSIPNVGGGTITGVTLPIGLQTITWRLGGPEGMHRNGETVTAKNVPELKDIPKGVRFLALYIYPDETVELALTEHYPNSSERGEAYEAAWKQRNGK